MLINVVQTDQLRDLARMAHQALGAAVSIRLIQLFVKTS